MAILKVTRDFVGESGLVPSRVVLNCNDTLATITTAGYLKQGVCGITFSPYDLVTVHYGTGYQIGMFTLVITNNIITMQPFMVNNMIPFKVTCTAAAMASAASVTLVPSAGTMQFQVMGLQSNSGGTNFSGGGGDRLGQITDGTTVYSVIPAASLQTLANAQWGATALPNPASAGISTYTAAGSSLVMKYSGGATDYSAGSVVIAGWVMRVA